MPREPGESLPLHPAKRRRELDRMTQTRGTKRWTVSIWARTFWLAWVGGITIAIAIDLVVTDGAPDYAAGILVAGFGSIYLYAFRPVVILTADELVVVNPFTTTALGLREISDVEASWTGLKIELADGRTFRGWAVQTTRLFEMLGRSGRADRAAAAIRAAIQDVKSQ